MPHTDTVLSRRLGRKPSDQDALFGAHGPLFGAGAVRPDGPPFLFLVEVLPCED